MFKKKKIKNKAILIDGSHDNCKVDGVKQGARQAAVILEAMAYMKTDPEYRKLVRGFMIESFLREGCQPIDGRPPDQVVMDGLSVTDPCLGWDDTVSLIHQIAEVRRSVKLAA